MYQKCFEKFTDTWLPTLAIVVFIVMLLILESLGFEHNLFTFSVMIVTVFAISMFRSRGVLKTAKAWRVGRDAERLVGQKLEELCKNDCYIFHDIKIKNKDCNIDHLVISNSGIFVVETKARKKTENNRKIVGIDFKNNIVRFANKTYDKKSLPQLNANMKWFDEQLYLITKEKYKTKGILIYTDSFINKDISKVKGIWVLTQNLVTSFIQHEKTVYQTNQIEWLAAVIEDYLRSYT